MRRSIYMLRFIFYYRRRKVLRLYFCVREGNNRLSFWFIFWCGRGMVILENLVILVDLDNLVVLGNLANLGIVPQITQIFTNL